jgi:hypothetical protein
MVTVFWLPGQVPLLGEVPRQVVQLYHLPGLSPYRHMENAGNLRGALHVIQMKRIHILMLTKIVFGFLAFIYNVDFLKKISLLINIKGHNPGVCVNSSRTWISVPLLY